MLQTVLQWMRDNVITVICAIVILISFGAFFWISMRGSAFVAEMQARQQDITEVKRYRSLNKTIPPADPDDPPTRIDMPVTEPAIAKLKKIYNDLDREFKGIYSWASKYNQQNHAPMLQGLFPKPLDPAKRFTAREAYVDIFRALYAALDAGTPPEDEEVVEALDRIEINLRQSYFLTPEQQLSETQERELAEKQAKKLNELYQRAAQRVHMYAPPLDLDWDGDWLPGPFQVGPWAKSSRPQIDEIWEGQMQLWIQQDLVQALRIANDVTNPETSLVQQPVKRLLAMYVKPGYVGVGELGEIDPTLVDPATLLTPEAYNLAIGAKLPNNFDATTGSPTGRVCNVVYDIRHAVLSVIVDSKQLPQLLNALGSVNYMTVIGMTTTDVDEFAELRNGYWYGKGVDAQKVDIEIETIWLRSWTAGHLTPQQAASAIPPEQFNAGLMPDVVRVQLGLPPRSQQSLTAPEEGAEDVAPPPGQPLPGATEPVPGAPSGAPAAPETAPEFNTPPAAPGSPGSPQPAPGANLP